MSMARDLLDFRAINTPVYRGQLVGIDRAAAMSLSAFEDVIEGQIEAKLSDGQATGEFLHLQRLIQKLEEMEPVRFQNRHKFMKKAYVGLAISHLLGFGYFVVGVPDVVGTFEIVFGLGDSPSYLSPLYSNGLWALFFVTLNRMRHNNSGSRVRNAYNRLKSIVHKVVAAEEGQVWPAQRLDGHPGLGTLDAANLCSMAVRNDPTKDIDPPATDRVLF